jgi:hypothetical protein
MLLTDGSGAVSWGAQPVAGLPSQTSNSGRLLTTNGSTASWSNAVTVSGSNATVGGSLTVSGTTTADGLATSGFFGGSKRVIAGYNTSSDYGFVASVDTGIGWKELHLNPVGGVVKVPNTAASTTTSSGALVVGNGTSGGLGVGGAIWGGGKVHVGSAGYADGGAKLNVYATPSDAGYLYGIRLSDNSTATLALGLQTPTGTTSSFIHSNIALGFGTVGVAALNINTSQQVQVLATTASSSTTTGALVVSGGVGVAGAINAGGILKTTVADAAYNARFFGATGGMRVRGYTDATYGTVVDSLNTAESAYQPLTIASSTLRLNDLTNGAIVTGTGTFTISGTTASTSTSSGALVVSGGVGVAGSINAGTTGANHSHVFTGGDLGSGSTILVARDSNGTNQFIVGGSGVVQITNSLQLNGSANVLRIVNSQTPASASATGTAGTIAWDSSYIYVCTATNTWKRVAISTW